MSRKTLVMIVFTPSVRLKNLEVSYSSSSLDGLEYSRRRRYNVEEIVTPSAAAAAADDDDDDASIQR
uniref:Secreted protein n=1 Tax=Syphacia muris TaxID=451379 RepID=A0A0N5AC26_9BILA